MKSYFIIIILYLHSCIIFGQKLTLKKASPFTAVTWENEQPIVQFKNQWYHFEKLDHLNKKEILDFCKREFGDKWKKRFSEDLVEVLQQLGHQPNVEVILKLFKDKTLKSYTGTFTFENRQRIRNYNKDSKTLQSVNTLSRKITQKQAIEDIEEFEKLIATRSSYAQITKVNYTAALRELIQTIKTKKRDIDINYLTNEMAKIMAEIGDRHSSVKNEAFDTENHKTYKLRLPFGLAIIDKRVVVLKLNQECTSYAYYDAVFPFLKSIDKIPVDSLISTYNYRDKKAPIATKLTKGATAIQKYGQLRFRNNKACPDSITVVLSNGISDKKETIKLTNTHTGYYSKVGRDVTNNRKKVATGDFNSLRKRINKTIGYINIPEMYHYDEVTGLESFITHTLQDFSDTNALIIDLRNNPGGARELLQTFASYIVLPEQSPWIANVAYVRTDSITAKNQKSMSTRYLYKYHSEKFTNRDRKAIDAFSVTFKTQTEVDSITFSTPFYMVLHNGSKSYTQPVYILVNENSFSAATVFTSAFKGLPNVKIVGVTPDGSSGNSRSFHLKHSNIRIKVSTMLSFQRNGKTLDGNGTVPDIRIPVDETQVLEGVDTQLKQLTQLINK